MIAVSAIIEQVRHEEKDNRQEKYSDWEILQALRKAIRYLANTCSTLNTEFFERMITIPEPMGGYDLPPDYITLKSVRTYNGYALSPATGQLKPNQYQIMDGRIYAHQPIILHYMSCLEPPTEGGIIDLPLILVDLIVDLTRMILTNTARDALQEFITQEVRNILPRRKYSNVKIGMDFKV